MENERKPEDDLHAQWKETNQTWTDFLKRIPNIPDFTDSGTCPYCHKPKGFSNMDNDDTFCKCRYDWPVFPDKRVVMHGWTCTKCGRSLSPFTSECPCSTPPLIVTC